MAADVKIDIAAEFTGKKAFKQADTATQKLTSGVKKLAGAVGLAYGTSAVIAFGKASVKAAAADQKAQQQLALALKNVGLGRDAATSEAYIQKLQSEFGIVDDLLRPAYQTLAVATRDSAEAQRLLNLSLDISASTGKDLGSVTAALSKAYLGNNTALSKLGVGISKADLKAKSFEDITNELTRTFAGSATAAAGTFQGSIDKLGVAAANVQEIIGTGLIDALTNLGENTSVADLASNMEKTALYVADVIRGVGVLTGKLKSIPVLGNLNVGMIPIVGSYIELLRKAGTKTADLTSADNAHLKSLQNAFKVTAKTTKETTAQLKASKSKAALAKAEAALAKGSDVFDIDKIQIAAAQRTQLEQLGKATDVTSALGIANNIARLQVKQDIQELEDAITSGDEKAIIAATNKLNADNKILGALQNQEIKVIDIKKALDALVPKDLINLTNLDEAIAKLKIIGAGFGATTNTGVSALTPAAPTVTELIAARVGTEISGAADPRVIYGGQRINSAGEYVDFNPEMVGMTAGGTAGVTKVEITVNTGIGDPNAIAEAIEQVVRGAVDRGTLRAS